MGAAAAATVEVEATAADESCQGWWFLAGSGPAQVASKFEGFCQGLQGLDARKAPVGRRQCVICSLKI